METSSIECQVCLRSATSSLPFSCPTCARNALYEPRLQHIQSILSREALGREVEQALSKSQGPRGSQPTGPLQADGKASATLSHERLTAELSSTVERSRTTLGHVEALRDEIKQMGIYIRGRRVSLDQRGAAITSAKGDLALQEKRAPKPVREAITKTDNNWNSLHNTTVNSRVFLCREVASLYGLQQKKRRKGVSGRDAYLIGGIPIVDIRDINNASPLEITVSSNHLAHLLHLTSHYLALRLPAEIILPNAAHPYSQIVPPLSSYNTPTLPFPLTKTSSTSSSLSAGSSKSKARSLYIDKPVLTLAADDTLAYSNFIESITLLAWDIAWVCKTQGLDVTARSWEDVCAIGKNMWLLFIAPATHPPIPRMVSGASDRTSKPSTANTTPTKSLATKELDPLPPDEIAPPPLGHFSHGTNHSFLPSAEGTEYMRNWKLSSPMRLIEKVKAALASERIAEWEVLEEGEWEGEVAEREEAAMATKKLGGGERDALATRRASNTARSEGVDEGMGKGKEAEKGSSGWMKVRGRGSEP
ncbi:hypothetical protein MMC30_006307 [Trapelia coarctata]|nr:hypothetical protein [Trapelia coarctata]